jgi:predicted DsbA family dithiol-disulfide isomerase
VLKERLVAATFTDGEPIGNKEALHRLAVDVGLPDAEVSAVLDGDDLADAVRADEEEARRLGVTGVPFFVFDRRYAVAGAQDPELLLSVLERAWSERAESVAQAGAPQR